MNLLVLIRRVQWKFVFGLNLSNYSQLNLAQMYWGEELSARISVEFDTKHDKWTEIYLPAKF